MDKPAYRSYLLRMWCDNALAPWRASLEPPGHGEPLAFADLEKLFAFLRAETEQSESLPPDSEDLAASITFRPIPSSR